MKRPEIWADVVFNQRPTIAVQFRFDRLFAARVYSSRRGSRGCPSNRVPTGAAGLVASRCEGRLAQLVRAPALQAGGRRFESCTAHHSAFRSETGDVVQLVRTLPCHGRGRGFESRRPRHLFRHLAKDGSHRNCPNLSDRNHPTSTSLPQDHAGHPTLRFTLGRREWLMRSSHLRVQVMAMKTGGAFEMTELVIQKSGGDETHRDSREPERGSKSC